MRCEHAKTVAGAVAQLCINAHKGFTMLIT